MSEMRAMTEMVDMTAMRGMVDIAHTNDMVDMTVRSWSDPGQILIRP